MSTIVPFFLFLSISTVFSKESAGGRGGGTGVLCEGKPLVLLEEFELAQEGVSIKVPNERDAVKSFVKDRLSEQPELFELWEKAWIKNGPFLNWKAVNYQKYLEEKVRNISFTLKHAKINEVFWENISYENDDEVGLIGKCKKIPLSYFEDGQVFRFESLEISERTKRFLELHESFYMLGFEEYGHLFSTKTRNLIKALNKETSFHTRSLVDFIKFSDHDRLAQRISGVYSSPYPTSTVETLGIALNRCPTSVIYLAESDNNIKEIAIYFRGGRKKGLDNFILDIKNYKQGLTNKLRKEGVFEKFKLRRKNFQNSQETLPQRSYLMKSAESKNYSEFWIDNELSRYGRDKLIFARNSYRCELSAYGTSRFSRRKEYKKRKVNALKTYREILALKHIQELSSDDR